MNGYLALASTVAPRHHRMGDDIWSTLINATGELAKKGVSYAQQQKAQEQSAKDSQASLDAVIAADQAATEASATAMVAAEAKTPDADAALQIAQQASAAQDAAAAGLSPDNQKKRADAAKAALTKALQAWQAASKSKNAAMAKAAEFRVKAAQVTYGKTQNAALVQQGQQPSAAMVPSGESWLTKRAIGPIPNWAVLVGGLALLGVGVPLIIKLVK